MMAYGNTANAVETLAVARSLFDADADGRITNAADVDPEYARGVVELLARLLVVGEDDDSACTTVRVALGLPTETGGATPIVPGVRVQLPAHTDEWMRGDRFGVVTAVSSIINQPRSHSVRLDKSGRTVQVTDGLRVV